MERAVRRDERQDPRAGRRSWTRRPSCADPPGRLRRAVAPDARSPDAPPPVSVHFVNNVLAAAASYVEDDPDQARDVLAELSAFLSYRLRPEPSDVPLAQELDHVGVYVRLQQARFPDRIEASLPDRGEAPDVRVARAGGAGPGGRRPRPAARRAAGPASLARARRRGRRRSRGAGHGAGRPGRRACGHPPGCGGSVVSEGTLAILAVDDEPRALADIQRLLENSPRVDRVATATSAKEALVHLSGGKLRRPLPRRRTCPRSRAWRSRGCCAASPTRPGSSS